MRPAARWCRKQARSYGGRRPTTWNAQQGTWDRSQREMSAIRKIRRVYKGHHESACWVALIPSLQPMLHRCTVYVLHTPFHFCISRTCAPVKETQPTNSLLCLQRAMDSHQLTRHTAAGRVNPTLSKGSSRTHLQVEHPCLCAHPSSLSCVLHSVAPHQPSQLPALSLLAVTPVGGTRHGQDTHTHVSEQKTWSGNTGTHESLLLSLLCGAQDKDSKRHGQTTQA